MLSFSDCTVCGFDCYTVRVKCPQRKFLCGHLTSTLHKSNPHTIQSLKDVSHAVAAITVTLLHPVYLNMIRHAQLFVDARDNHLQHLLWCYILSAFGYCINGPPLWSSGQGFCLQIQRSRVRFPALPDFLSGSGSGTGCTQPREPREVNWGATWIK